MFTLNNDLMKERSILGFGNYTKYNTKAAKVSFSNYTTGCK